LSLVVEAVVAPLVLEAEAEAEDLENHPALKEVDTQLHLKLVDLHYLFLHKVILYQLVEAEVIHLFHL
jgi:hypothetical protein